MANEIRVRQNFVGGLVDTADLAAAGTTLNSAALAAITTAIGSTNHFPIVLDPDGIYGAPEVVYITALTVGATSATILRGQEGTTARAHLLDTPWVHGPLVSDLATSGAALTTDAGTLGADVALTSTGWTNVLATNSLAVGTWLVTVSVLIANGATGSGAVQLVAGTATASFAGPRVAEQENENATTGNKPESLSFTTLVTVTVAGTLQIQGRDPNGGSFTTAKSSATNGGYANVTGYTAVKVA